MANIIPSKPVLLDHLGRPVDTSKLRQIESAPTVAGVRSIITGHPASGLTPDRLASILRGAETGDATRYLELAEQMEERDLHYLGVLGQRKRAVSQLEITVEAAGDDTESQADADLAREWVKREDVEDELFDMLDAVGKGHSALEIKWDLSERQWWPGRMMYVDPRFLEYDRIDGRTLKLKGDDGQPVPLTPFKYVVTEIKAKSGLPIRGGLARPVAWAWMFKNYTVKDWVAFAEVYGMPLRLGKYEDSATKEQRATLLRAVTDIGSDAAAIVPKGMDIEFIESKAGSGDGALFERGADWFDRQVSKAVLGQTMTTDAQGAGLGSSQAVVQDGVRADIERSDAKALAKALNRDAVQPLIDLNRGKPVGRGYPRIVIGRAESWNAEKMMPQVRTFVDMGGRVSMSVIRDRLGIPDPAPTDELLKPGKTAVEAQDEPQTLPVLPALASQRLLGLLNLLTGASGLSLASANRAAPAPADAIERFLDADLSDWEPQMQAVVGPVRDLMAQCSSLEELRDRLAEAMTGMNLDQTAELLARALFAARLAGASGIDLRSGE